MTTALAKRSLLLLTTLGLVAASGVAYTKHFRGAAFIWKRSTSIANAIEFRITETFKASELGPDVQVGDLFQEEEVFDFGDGTRAPVIFTITGIDRALDLAVGEALLEHTYADGTGVVAAGLSGCCRDDDLSGRGGAPYRLAVDLDPSGDVDAPRHGIPPVLSFIPQPRAARAIAVPLPVDTSGGDVRCRLATSAEMGGGADPAGVFVSPSCVLTWDTTFAGAGSYAIQIRADKIIDGIVQATSVADIVVVLTANRAPLPTCAFSPPSPIAAGVGGSTTITVTASGLSGNAAGLMLASEPFYGAGAVTYTQQSGMDGGAEYTLVLRPGDLAGRGFLTFMAGDKNGLGACTAAVDPVH